jgi:hypothetical protein
MKAPRESRAVLGTLALALAWLVLTPGEAAAQAQGPSTPPAAKPAADDQQADDHYVMLRLVFRVTLDQNPLVRVQCSIRDSHGTSDTMVWDPAERRGLTRYALLPKHKKLLEYVLECVSDRLEASYGASAYVFQASGGGNHGTPELAGRIFKIPHPLEVTGDWTVIAQSPGQGLGVGVPRPKLRASAQPATSEEFETVLTGLGGFEGVSSLRSFDPTTALGKDLLGSLATIALDRAREAGKQYVRDFLQDRLCERLTAKNVREKIAGTPLAVELEKWRPDQRLLQTTCALLDSARIDELVSARDAVWRAVAIDATVLAGALLKGSIKLLDDALVPIIQGAEDLMRVVIAGNTATTERDVQVLILQLGRVGLARTSSTWRYGLEAGFALLRDCLRDQSCSADELQRLFAQEVKLRMERTDKSLEEALNAWPALRTLLGRVIDVLRPAPGIDARKTAATAFEIVLDVAEHVIQTLANEESEEYKRARARIGDLRFQKEYVTRGSLRYEYTLAMIRTLRAISAAVRGEDPVPAVVELAKVLEAAILDYCKDRGKCPVPVETKDLQRAFAVVSALASYGASYRSEETGEGVPGDVQKQRAQERQKALKAVIDAFTDRSHRENEIVVSLGADVSVGLQGIRPLGGADPKGLRLNRNFLSLPMGLAVQQLPGADHCNFHVMITFIDLAQYLTVSDEQTGTGTDATTERKVPGPELVTALRLGLEAGFVFGRPSFPISASVHAAYLPRVTYGDEPSRGELRFGVSAGIFVPFLDFN